MRNNFDIFPTRIRDRDVVVGVKPDLTGIREEWDALVDGSTLPSPFLKSWWIENAASGELAIICVHRDGELIGGAAFEQQNWGPPILGMKKVTVVGTGLLAPDHIDIIHAPENRMVVATAVLSWLLRPGNRLIHLDGLAADGSLAGLFSHEATAVFEAPTAHLPADPTQYIASRPGRVRSTIKRRSKQLSASGANAFTATPDDLEAAITRFSELHDQRWSEQSEFLGAFDRFKNILEAGLHCGDVMINELRLDTGESIAVEIDLKAGERICFYQSGRRIEHEWRGSGTVLRAKIIEDAIVTGATEYDMLRGSEPYKAEWANSSRRLSTHTLRVGPLAKLAHKASQAINHVLSTVRP